MALAQSGSDMPALEQTASDLSIVVEELEKVESRWLELAELAGDL